MLVLASARHTHLLCMCVSLACVSLPASYEFVRRSLMHALERSDKEREMTSRMLSMLVAWPGVCCSYFINC